MNHSVNPTHSTCHRGLDWAARACKHSRSGWGPGWLPRSARYSSGDFELWGGDRSSLWAKIGVYFVWRSGNWIKKPLVLLFPTHWGGGKWLRDISFEASMFLFSVSLSLCFLSFSMICRFFDCLSLFVPFFFFSLSPSLALYLSLFLSFSFSLSILDEMSLRKDTCRQRKHQVCCNTGGLGNALRSTTVRRSELTRDP